MKARMATLLRAGGKRIHQRAAEPPSLEIVGYTYAQSRKLRVRGWREPCVADDAALGERDEPEGGWSGSLRYPLGVRAVEWVRMEKPDRLLGQTLKVAENEVRVIGCNFADRDVAFELVREKLVPHYGFRPPDRHSSTDV